jgi:hypothetical protein
MRKPYQRFLLVYVNRLLKAGKCMFGTLWFGMRGCGFMMCVPFRFENRK